jgi:phosphoribosylformylglycinamidine synthase
MRFRLVTQLKSGILDNAGKATTKALASLGFEGVQSVRIGRTLCLDCDESDIEAIARSQCNEVMENFTIERVTNVETASSF